MDRELSRRVIKKRRYKLITGLLLAAALLYLAIVLLRRGLQNSVPGNRIQIATAEIGPIEHTLTANGEVLPAFEQVISSSIQAEIRKVLLPVGSEITAGTPILEWIRYLH